jgi:hypothetical protein
MLARIVILQFAPSHPSWINNEKDILKHRVDNWMAGIKKMRNTDHYVTMEEIHDEVRVG